MQETQQNTPFLKMSNFDLQYQATTPNYFPLTLNNDLIAIQRKAPLNNKWKTKKP